MQRNPQAGVLIVVWPGTQIEMVNVIGLVLLYGGAVALLVGYIGIAFCGFAISFGRGIRNLILPFVAFGDAYNSYPFLLWVWAGGIAGIVLGALLTH
jgi:hypothetical protein